MPHQHAIRALDLLILTTSAPLWAPLMALLAITNRIVNGAPVIFTQERAGIHARPFALLKFRTMINNADNYLDDQGLPTRARITPLGMILRRSSLDELPQLINILKGDMSIVGPRPVLPSWVQKFPNQHDHPRFRVRPGLTGLAQIAGRNSVPWTHRLALDAKWALEPTVRNYVKIIAFTPVALLRPTVANDRNSADVDDLPDASAVSS